MAYVGQVCGATTRRQRVIEFCAAEGGRVACVHPEARLSRFSGLHSLQVLAGGKLHTVNVLVDSPRYNFTRKFKQSQRAEESTPSEGRCFALEQRTEEYRISTEQQSDPVLAQFVCFQRSLFGRGGA